MKEQPMNKSDLARMAGNIACGLVANPKFDPPSGVDPEDIYAEVAAHAVGIARAITVELNHETTEDPEVAKLSTVTAVDIKTDEAPDGHQE